MSNGTPPRACLADFSFITTILNPQQNLSCSVEVAGGTTRFKSPELLACDGIGRKYAKPTPQSDIYAFGLVIFQVCRLDCRYRLFLRILLQVLKGESPFHGILDTAVVCDVLKGKRPDKPKNASAIGFSDPLWVFTERCWGDKMASRPEVGEVVRRLEGAAANWNGPMPPCAQAKAAAPGPNGASGLMKPSEFDILILP